MKNRCQGRTKLDRPCRAAATEGGLCFFHANPKKASELGRVGGRSKRSNVFSKLDPLPSLETANGLKDFLSRLMLDTYEGRVDPRVAEALVPLLKLQAQITDTVVLDRALRAVSDLVEPQKPELDGDAGRPNQVTASSNGTAPARGLPGAARFVDKGRD